MGTIWGDHNFGTRRVKSRRVPSGRDHIRCLLRGQLERTEDWHRDIPFWDSH